MLWYSSAKYVTSHVLELEQNAFCNKKVNMLVSKAVKVEDTVPLLTS